MKTCKILPRRTSVLAVSLLLFLCVSTSVHAVEFILNNADPPGEGFNDPTPAEPVAGNPGATVGEQRQLAFKRAFELWGNTLDGATPIVVEASFSGLPCSANGGILGSAGPYWIANDFKGAKFPSTRYHGALANQLAQEDLEPEEPEIIAFFNGDIGIPGCLENASWYYGFDHKEPAGSLDFLAVLMHELSHGLGFSNFVDEATGEMFQGLPDVYTTYSYDRKQRMGWNDMTDEERAASSVSTNDLVWRGPAVSALAPGVLEPTTALRIRTGGLSGLFDAQDATFGPLLTTEGVAGKVALVNDGVGITSDACEPVKNISNINGKIALVDRGTCMFTVKVRNAQDAGAIAVIVANNGAEGLPGMAGIDAEVVIPSVGISMAAGDIIKAALPRVRGEMGHIGKQMSGASKEGWLRLYAPSIVVTGSSVSHWDATCNPNLLMEPSINWDLMESPRDTLDLTSIQLLDVGWKLKGARALFKGISACCSDFKRPGSYMKCYKDKARELLTNDVIDNVTYWRLLIKGYNSRPSS